MEKSNDENVIRIEIVEEEKKNEELNVDTTITITKTTTTTVTSTSSLSLLLSSSSTENTREKRIRKQKNYNDDYFSFDTNIKNKQSTNQNLTNDDNPKGECLDNEYLTNSTTNVDSNNSTTIEQQPSNSSSNEIKFNIGDLVWAKVSGHPWWPCTVATDHSEDNHVKFIGAVRPKRMFYVKFFGPSVEHAWVNESCLIEYKGIESFKTYAQDQVDQAPTKSQKEKLAERFQLKVALTRRDHWERAVDEADNAMNKRISTHKIENNNNKGNNLSNEDNIYYSENDENLTSSSSTLSIENNKISKVLKRDSTSSGVITNDDSNRIKTRSLLSTNSNKLPKGKVSYKY
jgi:hypothetical protein